MASAPTPEMILGRCETPPLRLALSCNQCGKKATERFAWAGIHPDLEACKRQGWDGISLSQIFECRKCGAQDDYTLRDASYAELLGRALRSGVLTGEDGPQDRVFLAESRLWDGSVSKRPSQALAHLRELTMKFPQKAEAHQRLGNACERFGLMEDAERSWRRAVEIDPDDIEILASLGKLLLHRETTAAEGLAFMQRAFAALGKLKSRDARERHDLALMVVDVIYPIVQGGTPLALMAGWRRGEVGGNLVVSAGSVDLRRLPSNWDCLVDFVASPNVLALSLTHELPEENPSLLERTIVRGTPTAMPPADPSPVRPRVGRNERCPCGSGQKYKRCCEGRPREPH
jgi:hypothetical protein